MLRARSAEIAFILVMQFQITFVFSWIAFAPPQLMSVFRGFSAGGHCVREARLTAAPLYKGEGMIGLQHMGQQLGKYPLISQSGVKTSLRAAPLSHSTLCLMKYLTSSVDKK